MPARSCVEAALREGDVLEVQGCGRLLALHQVLGASAIGSRAMATIPFHCRDYLPLPQVIRLLRFARPYFLTPSSTPDSAEIELADLTFSGLDDSEFPPLLQIPLPRCPEADRNRDEILEAGVSTMVQTLAASITNVGICAGLNRVSLHLPTGYEDWAQLTEERLNARNSGFELLLRYIEMYMRSHDIHSLSTHEYDHRAYRDFFGPDLAENLLPAEEDQKYAIGIDIGASSAKFQLYEWKKKGKNPDFEEASPEFRLGIQKEPQETRGTVWVPRRVRRAPGGRRRGGSACGPIRSARDSRRLNQQGCGDRRLLAGCHP